MDRPKDHKTKAALNGQAFVLANNPNYAFGTCFPPQYRMFVFNTLPRHFYIDFVAQELLIGAIYLVPPGHIHHLSKQEQCDFVCIDIKPSVLADDELLLFFSMHYQKQKMLCRPEHTLIVRAFWQEMQQLKDISFTEIRAYIQEQARALADAIPQQAMELAKRFSQILKVSDKRLLSLNVKEIAASLYCSERTLLRCSTHFFHKSVQTIRSQHRILLGLHLIVQKQQAFSEIAQQLGFSSLSAFNKSIKNATQMSPSAFQVNFPI